MLSSLLVHVPPSSAFCLPGIENVKTKPSSIDIQLNCSGTPFSVRFPTARQCEAGGSLNPQWAARCLILAAMNINIEELLQKLEVNDRDGLILAEAETVSAIDVLCFFRFFFSNFTHTSSSF